MKMLAKMDKVEVPVDEHVAPIRIPQPDHASPPLLTLDHAGVGYDEGKPILTNISLRFDPDDRIALLGKNGNGKSTLAKLLAGKLDVMGGEQVRARKLIVGYFAQHQLEELDGDITPVGTLQRARPKLTELQVRTQLGGFGFSADKANTHVSKLSGGERARLMLAMATLDKPNLLILDEPTNHLDIDARSELLTALNDFDGAVVLVSHDRRLLESTADRLLLVSDGKVAPFEGDLDDYRLFLLSGSNTATRREDKQPKDNARKDNADQRKKLKPLKDKAEKAEKEMAKHSAELAKLDASLANPKSYGNDALKGTEIARQRAEAQKALDAAEARWLEASEAYEKASA
jgi:ATP-binding cassette subfamily F protein 3